MELLKKAIRNNDIIRVRSTLLMKVSFYLSDHFLPLLEEINLHNAQMSSTKEKVTVKGIRYMHICITEKLQRVY